VAGFSPWLYSHHTGSKGYTDLKKDTIYCRNLDPEISWRDFSGEPEILVYGVLL
jgi:hypothetical protein